MIDNCGYRKNVGMVICNTKKKLLLAKKYRQKCWQFPQGGINLGETVKQAMYRELFEELGLLKKDVQILICIKSWIKYNIPKYLIRKNINPICIGQKQKWFLLKLISSDNNINIKNSNLSEFDIWKWVNFWYPINKVIFFKKNTYIKVLNKFNKFLMY